MPTDRSTESQVIRVARALGDPTRFGLLQAIAARDEISCQELTSQLHIAQATVSHHLKVLTDAGLVSARKEGPFHYCRALHEALAAHGRMLADTFAQGERPRPRARTPARSAGPEAQPDRASAAPERAGGRGRR